MHAAYNRPVRLPFAASHETLLRNDRLYDAALVLDWNISRRVRGLGSAIFLHVARDDYRPTEGCVALDPRDVRLILEFVRRGDVIRVV
jgi:L,D-peptidoglycan transpeptidase YkuD (ErfK/YbiS/YcfS/YnhG family)